MTLRARPGIVALAALLLSARALGLAPSRIGHAARHGVSAKPLRDAVPGPRSQVPSREPESVHKSQPHPSAPIESLQFDGATSNDNLPFFKDVFPPPDANGAAGPQHYFQAINLVFRIFDKSGNTVLGPLPTYSLWSGLGGVCETGNVNTPLVKFDALAARWFVSQAGFDPSDASTHVCIAVSQTSDPTGTYYQYDFPIDPSSIATSARVGIWPDGYYLTINQFKGFANAGFGVYAFDRLAMLGGDPAAFVYADAGATNPETLWGLPADLDGTTPPPVGAPNVALALGSASLDGSPNDLIHVWRFHADFETPENSTFEGPVDVPIDPFTPLECGGPTEGCVPQRDSDQLLQATPNRLMYRLAYRNFTDHEALVTNFTLDAGGGLAAIRWFEMRDPNGSPFVFQQATYAPDDSYRFVGSIAMDRVGNLALGYSKSDATIHPSLAVTGRLVFDPPGTMGSESTFFEGPNSQPPVVGSWGFYSSMALDPVDDCTFWFTAEYTGEPAPFFEYTRVGSFKFPSCSDSFTGTLQGTVTEAGSGQPVPGARVTAGLSDTVTDDAGHYQFLLPEGTYDMTAVKFGFIPGSASDVVVTFDETTTQDFALEVAPHALLNGVVRDGSGGGWQLYARIKVTGPPEFTPVELFTDPVTGYYGIDLVTGITYNFATEAVVPGYQPDARSLLLDASAANRPAGTLQNIALTVDPVACNAPGYGLVSDGLSESFDAGTTPPGWSIVNNGGGAGWSIHTGGDPCGLFPGNQTGGSGPYALVNSHCDGEVGEDTELITDSVNATSLTSVQIRFHQDFNGGSPAFGEIADVDVSTDGGTSWTNVLHQTVAVAGPDTQSIDVTALAAGQADVRARFHYYNAFNALYWQVDDVIFGQTSCRASEGGLVVGNVLDANSGDGLNGATVVNVHGGPAATSFATPDDPAQPDGLYVLFSESSSQSFSASLDLYAPQIRSLTVVPNDTQRLDFSLPAGRLDATPRPLSVRVDPGEIVQQTLTMSNNGTGDATFSIQELNVPPIVVPVTPGPFVDRDTRSRMLARIPNPALRNAPTAKGIPALPGGAPSVPTLGGGNVINVFSTNLSAPWGVAFDTDAGDFWVSNSALFAGDNLDYRFTTDGTQTDDTIDDSGWIADFAADGAYDPRTKKLWRVNVGGDDCVYELDPAAKAATGNKICPAFGTSERGLAYDVVTNTFYAGSWTDGVIDHFDTEGTILDSVYVAVPVSGLAFNSTNGRLYALTNHDVLLGFDVYVFDTHAGMAVLGAFNITAGGTPVLSPNGGAGMEIDCNGHLWLIDSNETTIFEVETEETDVCAFKEIPWLTEEPAGGTVAAGANLPVTCTFDSTGLSPGLRVAQLLIPTDTPYAVAAVPVDLTVRFADVADDNIFQAFIYGAAGAGVMPGCEPAAFLFCPTDLVTRADMAGFILRAVHGADFVPTPYAGAFLDVQAGDYNADYIQSFFDEGYTVGCGGGNFCPDAVHTRGQTAVFILKGEHGTAYVPLPCASTHEFDDVPCPPTPQAPFGDWIGQLFVEGVTAGCGGNNFCPTAGIPNQQMATFLVRAFGLPHL